MGFSAPNYAIELQYSCKIHYSTKYLERHTFSLKGSKRVLVTDRCLQNIYRDFSYNNAMHGNNNIIIKLCDAVNINITLYKITEKIREILIFALIFLFCAEEVFLVFD